MKQQCKTFSQAGAHAPMRTHKNLSVAKRHVRRVSQSGTQKTISAGIICNGRKTVLFSCKKGICAATPALRKVRRPRSR